MRNTRLKQNDPLQHGNLLLCDTFLEVRRYDGRKPLPDVRLVEIPLHETGPEFRPAVRDMNEALLRAAIDMGEVLVVAERRYCSGKPVLVFDADLEELMTRWRRSKRPAVRPTIEKLFANGVIFHGSELAARRAAAVNARPRKRKSSRL